VKIIVLQNLKKNYLTEICKRATPDEWSRFATASKVLKIIRDEQLKPLVNLLQITFCLTKKVDIW